MLFSSLAKISSPLPSNHSRETIAGGNLGTAQTIRRMRDLVTQGKRDFEVRKKLQAIIGSCPNKDFYCFAKRAHEFCRDRIKYIFDPNGVELIESPRKILESGVADCDSIVVLLATLCEQMGMRCEFVTIKADSQRPNDFSHVYLQIYVPKHGWVGADATMPDQPFGWRPGEGFPKKTWPASNDEPEVHDGDQMTGLGMVVPGTAKTPGVIVGKPWEWRDEPALITATPESLELEPLSRPGSPEPMTAEGEDFFIRSDPNPRVSVLGGLGAEQAEIVKKPSQRGANSKHLFLYAGLALAGLFLLGKK